MADQKLTALTADTSIASTDITYTVEDPGGTPVSKKVTWANIATALAGFAGLTGTFVAKATVPTVIIVPFGDETTAITTGTAKRTFRMPFAMTLPAVRASLTTVSSSGIPTFDINEGGSTILSTKLTIDASEKTSTTAATAAVISDSALADDAEITIDIDVAGTGATGPKIYLIGTRAV